jgi:hypothetical protein
LPGSCRSTLANSDYCAEGSDDQQRSVGVEFQNLDQRSRILGKVCNPADLRFQSGDGVLRVDAMGQLGPQIDPAEGVARVVDDIVREDLIIADHDLEIISGVDRGGKDADFLDLSRHTSGGDHVPDFERPQYDQEDAGCEVSEEAGPTHADCHTGGGDDRSKGGGGDTQRAEDCHKQ